MKTEEEVSEEIETVTSAVEEAEEEEAAEEAAMLTEETEIMITKTEKAGTNREEEVEAGVAMVGAEMGMTQRPNLSAGQEEWRKTTTEHW